MMNVLNVENRANIEYRANTKNVEMQGQDLESRLGNLRNDKLDLLCQAWEEILLLFV